MSESKEILNNEAEEMVVDTIDAETDVTAAEVDTTTAESEELSGEMTKLLTPKQIKIFVGVLIVAIIGFVVLLLTPGTSGVATLEGTWVLTQVESGEGVIEGEDLELAYGGPVIYNLNQEGQLVIEMIGQEFHGEWIQDENTIEVIYNGGSTLLKYEEPVMTMSADDVKYTLELK